jgi:hypothetical protein
MLLASGTTLAAAATSGTSNGVGVGFLAVLGLVFLIGNKSKSDDGPIRQKVRKARTGLGLGALGGAALLLVGMTGGTSGAPTTPHRPPAVTVPHTHAPVPHKTSPRTSGSGGKHCPFICVDPKN